LLLVVDSWLIVVVVGCYYCWWVGMQLWITIVVGVLIVGLLTLIVIGSDWLTQLLYWLLIIVDCYCCRRDVIVDYCWRLLVLLVLLLLTVVWPIVIVDCCNWLLNWPLLLILCYWRWCCCCWLLNDVYWRCYCC